MIGCPTDDSGGGGATTVKLTFENGYDTTPIATVVNAPKGKALGLANYAQFPDLDRPFYDLTKWIVKDDANAVAVDENTVFNADTVLVAQWAKITYKVIIDLNGGKDTKATPSVLTYSYDADGNAAARTFSYSNIPSSSDLSQTGYDFEGWYNGDTEITVFTGGLEVDENNSPVIIRANWELTVAPATFVEVLALENTSQAIYSFSLPAGKTFGDYIALRASFKLEYPENAAGEGQAGAIQIRAFRLYGNYKASDFITKDGDYELNAYIAKFDTYNADYISVNAAGWAWDYTVEAIGWDSANPTAFFEKEFTLSNPYPSKHWPDADDTGPFYFGIGISGTGGNHIVQHVKDIYLVPRASADDKVYSTTSGFDKPAFASYSPIPKESSPYRGTAVPAIVKFSLNGQSGDVDPAIVFVAKGTAIGAQLPATATAPGYIFQNWSDAATGGTAVTSTTTFSANATVYAVWIEDPDYVPPDPEAAHPFPTATGDTEVPLSITTLTWDNAANQKGWAVTGEAEAGKFTWASHLVITMSQLPNGLELAWKGKKDNDNDFGGWNSLPTIIGWSVTETVILDGYPGVTVTKDATTSIYTVTIELSKVLKTYFKYIQCVDEVGLLFQTNNWAASVESAKLIVPKKAD